MSPQSDEDLMEALRDGDETAIRTLVERHTPSIYRFCVRYTGDESLAEDVCQEVFLKLYRYARRYKLGMPFKTWLFTLVRNTSIDFGRLRAYRKIYSIGAGDEATILEAEKQPLMLGDQNPEEIYSSKQTAQRVASALRSLPEKQRTAVILKFYHDMPVKEIAGVMEITVSSVESLLVRAKRNLLKLLPL